MATQFQKGQKKIGGRKKGSVNKTTQYKIYMKQCEENMEEVFNAFSEISKMNSYQFNELGKPAVRKKLSMIKLAAMQLMQSAVREKNIKAMEFIYGFVLGSPNEYYASKFTDIVERTKEYATKAIKEYAGVRLDMDFLLKWSMYMMNDFSGHPIRLNHFMNMVKMMMEMIHKRDMLDFAKNNTYTLKEMQEVLDSMSELLQYNFSGQPDMFSKLKDDLINRLSTTKAFDRIETVDSDIIDEGENDKKR